MNDEQKLVAEIAGQIVAQNFARGRYEVPAPQAVKTAREIVELVKRPPEEKK